MEKSIFSFPQPMFMTKKSTVEKITEPAISFSTCMVGSSHCKSSLTETLNSSAELEEPAPQEPELSSHFSTVFQRPFNSATVADANQFFSPSNAATEFPFTSRRKPTRMIVTKSLFPGTPVKTGSLRTPSESGISERCGEEEERRPQSRASVSSFFHRPFGSPSSECVFTPKRKQIKAEIGHEDCSSISSPIGCNGGNARRFGKQSLFGLNGISRAMGENSWEISENSEQLPAEPDGRQCEDENSSMKTVDISEHPGFNQRFQSCAAMGGEKSYFGEDEKRRDPSWVNSTQPGKWKTSLESKLQAFTGQLLAAAEEAECNVKAENASLKQELSRSQKYIVNLEAQFDQLKKKQSEAIKKANLLSLEKKTICDRLKNLQEQMSAVEEEFGKKREQHEEMNLQLADKEQRLKLALDDIASLEEMTRSSDERVCDLQAQLQLILTERKAADEKIATMSKEADSLRENLISLESAMSNAENKFQSTISDYKHQQEKLQEEITCYQETALNEARAEYHTVKGELSSCIEELVKTKEGNKVLSEENHKLEERLGCLNEKYVTFEQSSVIARENLCSLETTVSSLQAEIQQLNQHLETSHTELTNSKEKMAKLQEENETLRDKLNSCRNQLTTHEEQFQLELTRTQEELSCEKKAHSETKKSAMAVLSETRNVLKTHIKELQGESVVEDSEDDEKKREWDGDRAASGQDEFCWKLYKDELETYFHLLLDLLRKVQSTIRTLKEEIISRNIQINELQKNIGVCEGQVEYTKQELQSERVAHNGTKSSWKQCKDQLETERKEHLIKLSQVQNALQKLNGTKSSLEAQISSLEANLSAVERENEAIKQELCFERDAHSETMSNWKFCKEQLSEDQHQHSVELSKLQSAMEIMNDQKKFVDAQVTDLQNKLVMTGQNHESIREKNLSLERQLEYASIEISTLRAEVRDHSVRNHEIQALLDSVQMKSALSGDSFEAALSKCRKELDSQQEIQRETMRSLTETCFKLRSAEDICDQALQDRTKLQSDIAHLTKEKLENEEVAKRLETEISAQEKNIDSLTACNVFLNQTLVCYEDFIKAMHKKCQLMFAENSNAAINVKELTIEIKTLTGNFQIIQKSAQIVDENLTDFNVCFGKLVEMETVSSIGIQNRLATANSHVAISNEALKTAATEKSLQENFIRVASAEKMELEKQIEITRENFRASEAIEKHLRNENTALEEMKTSSYQQIVDLQERVRSSDEKIANLQKDKADLETQLESLRCQLEAGQYKYENTIGVLTTEKEELEDKLISLTETADNWKLTNEKFCTRNAALKSSLMASNQQISDLHQRINSLDTELTLSKEKVKDLAVEKTNLESQLGSLRHQLKESREKFSRDLEKMRHQLDSEKASYENFKLRVAVIPPSPEQSTKFTNERKQKCLKLELLGQAVVELDKRLVNDNEYLKGPRSKLPASPLTIAKEKLNSHPLNNYHDHLQKEKGSHRNKANFENQSRQSSVINRYRDSPNNSSKIADVDKHDSKIFANNEENKPVTIVQESPPASVRKPRTRRATVAANRSFPIQLDHDESPRSGGSSELSKTQTSDEISVFRERRKLVLTPLTSPSSCVRTPSPTRNSTSTKATAPMGVQEAASDSDVNESFATKPFAPAKKTYTRKRLSMTARLVSANTVSTQSAKKPRRATK